MGNWVTWLLIAVPLAAQAPDGWNRRERLGADRLRQPVWSSAGLWAGDHHGPAAPITDSLGLGNGLTGGGFHVEGGFRWNNWDFAAELLGNRNTQGQAYATLYRAHAWYLGPSGWQAGFEQEPLVWGYGLNGGYLLGETARPFPRLRVETPMVDLRPLGVPLGRWGLQWFTGRLENHRQLAPTIQDRSGRSRAMATQGDVQAPMLTGYRAQATFGPLLEFYMNMMVMWSGTRNGRGLTEGYGVADYLHAMSGLKDAWAEGGTDFSQGTQNQGYATRVQSASELDWGLRFKAPFLARWMGADKAWLYVSRGTKSAFWPIGVFLRRPLYYGGKDLKFDVDNLITRPNLGSVWYQKTRYTAPTEGQPNDTFGIQANWSRVRAGFEAYSGINDTAASFRPFTHGTYLTGFYTYGDPLGMGQGGETNFVTAKLEADIGRRFTGAWTVIYGYRPFRDNLTAWKEDHPGETATKDHFLGAQQSLVVRLDESTTVSLGAAWQRHGAVDYVQGRSGNGFAWFTDVTFCWPNRRVPGWPD